jgi:hypothetical protein
MNLFETLEASITVTTISKSDATIPMNSGFDCFKTVCTIFALTLFFSGTRVEMPVVQGTW